MLADVLSEIGRQGGNDSGTGPEPVVSLELFFEGNNDLGSIGCNLIDHPGIPEFYAVLRALRAHPDVVDVRVGISEVMGDDEWPFSNHVYIVTSASATEVLRRTARLQPEPEMGSDWWNGTPPAIDIPVPSGHQLMTLWWD
ncbi:hypothetical protein [Actinoplanes couchii]|uniref:Uncharacterized protein n=1 Tax=Actinoplanes couchii TaxID=403638 RepID=A0ABQ3XNF4_9ACTN|nr:hypothetical protein [Actinoplanes couchii]MDR6318081.1 hypothetical protein [Actinoplanes couchii]GID60003.1 hypothetical protein Aco03nite_084070 [Actinoplanes couchii]